MRDFCEFSTFFFLRVSANFRFVYNVILDYFSILMDLLNPFLFSKNFLLFKRIFCNITIPVFFALRKIEVHHVKMDGERVK